MDWTTFYLYLRPIHRVRPVIPSNDAMPSILEHFDLDLKTFQRAFTLYAHGFFNMWYVWETVDRGMKINEETLTLTYGDKTFKVHKHDDHWTVDGLISTPEFDHLMRTFTGSAERNPWNCFYLTLHSKVTSRFYDELAVKGFDDLFPTQTDIDDFRVRIRKVFLCHEAAPRCMFGQQVIYLLDSTKKINYYSDMPASLKSYLALKVANRRNPTGHLLPHKDLFKQIIQRDLKGRDLIRVCNASKAIRDLSFSIFPQCLRDEFGIKFERNNHGYPNARCLYIQMHTMCIQPQNDLPKYMCNDFKKIKRGEILSSRPVYAMAYIPPIGMNAWIPYTGIIWSISKWDNYYDDSDRIVHTVSSVHGEIYMSPQYDHFNVNNLKGFSEMPKSLMMTDEDEVEIKRVL